MKITYLTKITATGLITLAAYVAYAACDHKETFFTAAGCPPPCVNLPCGLPLDQCKVVVSNVGTIPRCQNTDNAANCINDGSMTQFCTQHVGFCNEVQVCITSGITTVCSTFVYTQYHTETCEPGS
jgi:hypothetical protein